ncbi:hypothetical protein K3M67_04745 [Sphingobium sp. V4]|uniref:hypothetical protein n=1 Tax=Sphingobium sp. V4 TaxID=3038927 RepID=UPI0025581CC9|nr:hypothetical protein [Sphingobium sp. V4]WIW89287.1 hypothetical protein K3M67_04745 [Sphingobium sp. V4]
MIEKVETLADEAHEAGDFLIESMLRDVVRDYRVHILTAATPVDTAPAKFRDPGVGASE